MKALLLLILISLSALAEEKKSFSQIRAESSVFFTQHPHEALKDFDELELDLLYQDLPNLTILELYRKYPELGPKELEELKSKRK